MPHLGLGPEETRAPQRATYFCVEDKHWQIIGLDTGYHSVKFGGVEMLMKILNKIWLISRISFIRDWKTKLPKRDYRVAEAAAGPPRCRR